MANSLIKSMLMTLTNVPEYEDNPRKEKELGCIAECNVGISNNWFHDRTTLRLYPDCVHIIRTRHNTNAEVPSDQVIMLSDIDHIEVTTITKARVIRFGNEASKDRPYSGQYYPNEVVFDEKYLQNVNEFVSAVRERIKKKSATKGFDTIINTGTINIFNYTETVNIIDIYQQIENEGGADKAELKSLLVDICKLSP